ncbi:Retrovirus-related Pol polyprotein from transposon 17.6, partial [Mucuna pruriens]
MKQFLQGQILEIKESLKQKLIRYKSPINRNNDEEEEEEYLDGKIMKMKGEEKMNQDMTITWNNKVVTNPEEDVKAKYSNAPPKGKIDTNTSYRSRGLNCFRCQGVRHITSQCPNKRAMIMMDNGEIESESSSNDEMPPLENCSDVKIVEPVDGVVLVTRRALSIQLKEDGDVEQCEHIFHTRCHINDKRFLKNFSSIAASLNELVKKNVVFKWDDVHEKAINLLKDKLINASLLCLPNFDKAFEIECDAFSVGIEDVLMQESKPIAYFSEKLSGTTLNYSTYDKELYALVRTLQIWQHYLWPREFVNFDHQSLKFLKSQGKLQKTHAKWLEFIEMFPYVIKYKNGKENIVADALSRRYALLTSLQTKLLGFEIIKNFFTPLSPLDILTLLTNKYANLDGKQKADFVRKLHAKVRANIEKRSKQYARQANKECVKVTFEPGDWIWVHMRKERFPTQRKFKLQPRGDRPFQVVERIVGNAYKLYLPTAYGEKFDSRMNPFEDGGNDRDSTNKVVVRVTQLSFYRQVVARVKFLLYLIS